MHDEGRFKNGEGRGVVEGFEGAWRGGEGLFNNGEVVVGGAG